jgi:hypothetical protein
MTISRIRILNHAGLLHCVPTKSQSGGSQISQIDFPGPSSAGEAEFVVLSVCELLWKLPFQGATELTPGARSLGAEVVTPLELPTPMAELANVVPAKVRLTLEDRRTGDKIPPLIPLIPVV